MLAGESVPPSLLRDMDAFAASRAVATAGSSLASRWPGMGDIPRGGSVLSGTDDEDDDFDDDDIDDDDDNDDDGDDEGEDDGRGGDGKDEGG